MFWNPCQPGNYSLIEEREPHMYGEGRLLRSPYKWECRLGASMKGGRKLPGTEKCKITNDKKEVGVVSGLLFFFFFFKL